MIYKNARIYTHRLASEGVFTHQQIESHAFVPCGPTQAKSAGWVPPFQESDQLVHYAEGTTLLCLQIEERILPAEFVRRKVQEAVDRIEAEQARKVYRKERLTIKDEVIAQCLPHAFTRQKRVLGHIDHAQSLLVIDTSSASVAVLWINTLRECVGRLRVFILEAGMDKSVVLTSITKPYLWQGKAVLLPGTACKLYDRDEHSKITIRDEDLTSDEVQAHIDGGMVAIELQVKINDIGHFTITEDLVLKQIRLDAQLIHQESGELEDTAKQDADYCLNVRTLREIFTHLSGLFAISREGNAGEPMAEAAA